jgi:hypothetical protein
MLQMSHSRRFDHCRATTGLPRTTDMPGPVARPHCVSPKSVKCVSTPVSSAISAYKLELSVNHLLSCSIPARHQIFPLCDSGDQISSRRRVLRQPAMPVPELVEGLSASASNLMPLLGRLGLMPLRGRSGNVFYSLRVSLRRRLREGLHAGESGGGDKR